MHKSPTITSNVPADQQRNVMMSDNPAAGHEFNMITNANGDEHNEGSDVETVLGSVHISKPSIQHVFFLLRPILKPVLEQFNQVHTSLADLVNLLKIERVFLDNPAAISQNVPYVVDYKQRKYLYAMSRQALTLSISGNSVSMLAGQWIPLEYPVGTQVYASGVGDGSPATITVRATDVPLTLSITSGSVTINNTDPNSGATGIGTFTLVRTVLNLPSAARASYSAQFGVGDLRELSCLFNVASFTGGTSPTVTFKVSTVGADGTVQQLEQATAISAAGVISYSIGAGLDSKAFGSTIQVDMVTTGSPTSITFSASIVGK